MAPIGKTDITCKASQIKVIAFVQQLKKGENKYGIERIGVYCNDCRGRRNQ
jgi:hypothetical protein